MPHTFPTPGHPQKLWGGPLVRSRPPGRLLASGKYLILRAGSDEGVPRGPGGSAPRFPQNSRSPKKYAALVDKPAHIAAGSLPAACPCTGLPAGGAATAGSLPFRIGFLGRPPLDHPGKQDQYEQAERDGPVDMHPNPTARGVGYKYLPARAAHKAPSTGRLLQGHIAVPSGVCGGARKVRQVEIRGILASFPQRGG